ncbi:hypothetical protein O6H91_20G041100 [Diphasiastrum complanatum]|uniref:Uncharacterized protein n=2 Tax=Diphasiastrum complanatum TaxID=34168 RepID=A0ACC2APL8_DIPCM|nr:hypothetical protein O6H91_20G041100 [Diphasiastrum complanatum]KAJ7519491.1 hypothetical protein O6H91_20G041100 [Diphasiastrum complanatum]
MLFLCSFGSVTALDTIPCVILHHFLGIWFLAWRFHCVEMDSDEIGVVLLKAAELHTKISDAIERSMKAEFLLTVGGGGRTLGKGQEASAASEPERYRGEIIESDETSARAGAGGSEGNVEARSLASVRDALEVLEEQLECLQTLQQQQRAERDAALAELEESRRILLKRLKNHHGNEWEVVHEALAFAGEPVSESDELPLPPYPMPLDVHSPEFMGSPISIRGINVPIKRLALADSQDEGPEGEIHSNGVEDAFLKQAAKVKKGILGFQPHVTKFVGDLFGKGVGLTAKVTMLAATVITLIFFADVRQRSNDQKTSKDSSKVEKVFPQKHSISHRPTKSFVQEEICPPGKIMIMQDGYPKCVVKERTEIPFHKEIKSPDVLYGRG